VADSERRDRLLARQRELRGRHDGLADLDAETLHRTERLDPLLRGTDELMRVVDDLAAETAHRLVLATFVLLCLAAVPAVLVAVGVLPAPALLGSLLLLAAAAALWFISRHTAGTGS
jgi:hypothetical protein